MTRHADITEIQTADGKTSYIYFVVDNFSRYITSWRVADNISAKIQLETFSETINNAEIEPSEKQETVASLIVDGGTENNNKHVETFIKDYPIEKLVALKDILKSNAMIESINKIIKYDYLFPNTLKTIKFGLVTIVEIWNLKFQTIMRNVKLVLDKTKTVKNGGV
ncbi:MAG: transposase family protein [Chitinophagaceae bacterium]|nr:transposase family protein [Chitinophagaceae bacterium]MCW5905070.1 transposase family protein [Chitinophagaceae bacterium]